MNKFEVGQRVVGSANINGEIFAISGAITRTFAFGSKAVAFVTVALDDDGPVGYGSVSVPASRVELTCDA